MSTVINNGVINVYFEQKGKDCYITYGDGAIPMPTTVKRGNEYYKSLRNEGFVVGAMESVASPKKPKASTVKKAKKSTSKKSVSEKSPKATSMLKVHWEFKDGFDREEYLIIAEELNVLICVGSDRKGRPIYVVPKKHRERIYKVMGATRVIR